MKEYLEYIVKNLVSNPDAVEITEREDDRGPVLSVKVAEEDVGKIIGKEGRIAKSIRTIIRAASKSGEKSYYVEIL